VIDFRDSAKKQDASPARPVKRLERQSRFQIAMLVEFPKELSKALFFIHVSRAVPKNYSCVVDEVESPSL
jgi:hypothetical protein